MKKYSTTAWLNGDPIAKTSDAIYLEGNYYFPKEDVAGELSSSLLTSLCYWKGIARYRHLTVAKNKISNAAWTYPIPTPFAWFIRNRIAFNPAAGIYVIKD
jgi:uncharacterized protein (DUF427 family)